MYKMIKLKYFLVALVANTLLFAQCQNLFDLDLRDEEEPEPILSLNANLTLEELEKYPNGIFITQFLTYMLTGTYDGTVANNTALDQTPLADVLDGGLQALLPLLAQNLPTDQYIEVGLTLIDILDRLERNGTRNVTFGEIRPFLTYNVALGAAYFYFSSNKENFNNRFKNYLDKELLGGLKGACKLHSFLWFDGLPKGQFWAIEMFDSIAKLPPGVLSANINWLGNHKECTRISSNITRPIIKGKYCRATIGFPISQFAGDLPITDDIGLDYGLCVSSYCTKDEVASLVSNSLKLMSVFKSAWVKEINCDESKPLTTASTIYLELFGVLFLVILLSTAYDIYLRIKGWQSKKEVEEKPEVVDIKKSIAGQNVVNNKKTVTSRLNKLEQFAINCSFYTNTQKFFRTDNGGKISCLNGIRMFSMIWIIWGHTYNYIGDRSLFFLLDNIRDLQELNEELYAQIIINGMYGVDTFFLMSAFLLTISFMNKMEKSKRLTIGEWIYYYVHRYWRLAPPFLITIVIYTKIMPYWGWGPLWTPDKFPPNKDDCENYWFAYVLFVNNFVPDGRGTKCMGYLWYIPNDYQFYALSPLFLIILFKFPKAGKVLLSFTLTASLLILAFLTANVYVSRKRVIINVLLDIWEDVYIKPYCRATPWLVGIFLGFIFFKKKSVKLSPIWVIVGWTLSTICGLASVFGGFTNHAKDGRRMEVAEYAIFFSLTRLAWSFSISWIIFSCYYGYGGIINTFLSTKSFIPITRLSYCAYLIHPTLMVFYNYTQETLFHATGFTLVYLAIGHIFVTFFFSYIYTLLFELPFVAVEKLIYSPRH